MAGPVSGGPKAPDAPSDALPAAADGPRQRGAWAERLACGYLRQRGLTLLTRNFRARRGELDLVMREGDTLVFVEVRYRGGGAGPDAAESIDRRKRERLLHAGARYLQQYAPRDAPPPCRFDVVAVSGGRECPVIRWLQGAFEA